MHLARPLPLELAHSHLNVGEEEGGKGVDGVKRHCTPAKIQPFLKGAELK